MNQLEKIDKNFKIDSNVPKETKFYDVRKEPFSVHGLYLADGTFDRAPLALQKCEEINRGARILMQNCSGGRVRFVSDSPYVAISVKLRDYAGLSHMAASGVRGFDLYAAEEDDPQNPDFAHCFMPPERAEELEYSGIYEFSGCKKREFTLCFPLYCGVEQLYIGLAENAALSAPRPYKISAPIVFYGSSITQGACASRPGNCYHNILSRWLDSDILNLGFSGAALGEEKMAEYIASLPMSALIYDYCYNAPNNEHLAKTHAPFYRIIREKNPKLPIIMMTSPRHSPDVEERRKMRATVMRTYVDAVEAGDRNVYFVDGEALLDTMEPYSATVDRVHPTDLGFRHMAKMLYPILKKVQ